jgi:flagellar hook-basal body complex protein FliE
MKVHAIQAAQAYGQAKAVVQGEQTLASANSTSAFDVFDKTLAAISKGENTSIEFMSGGADPHSVVEAMAAAELAIETAATIRDKVVEAYQELLRMPV